MIRPRRDFDKTWIVSASFRTVKANANVLRHWISGLRHIDPQILIIRLATDIEIVLIYINEVHDDKEWRQEGVELRNSLSDSMLFLRGIKVGRAIESVERHSMKIVISDPITVILDLTGLSAKVFVTSLTGLLGFWDGMEGDFTSCSFTYSIPRALGLLINGSDN